MVWSPKRLSQWNGRDWSSQPLSSEAPLLKHDPPKALNRATWSQAPIILSVSNLPCKATTCQLQVFPTWNSVHGQRQRPLKISHPLSFHTLQSHLTDADKILVGRLTLPLEDLGPLVTLGEKNHVKLGEKCQWRTKTIWSKTLLWGLHPYKTDPVL